MDTKDISTYYLSRSHMKMYLVCELFEQKLKANIAIGSNNSQQNYIDSQCYVVRELTPSPSSKIKSTKRGINSHTDHFVIGFHRVFSKLCNVSLWALATLFQVDEYGLLVAASSTKTIIIFNILIEFTQNIYTKMVYERNCTKKTQVLNLI